MSTKNITGANHYYVSQAECAQIRYCDRTGETLTAIAEALGRGIMTVKRHADGECSHTFDADSPEIQSRMHLSATPFAFSRHTTDGPGEAYCLACRARITVGPDGTEYGHLRGNAASESRCPHRPDTVDTNGVSRRGSE